MIFSLLKGVYMKSLKKLFGLPFPVTIDGYFVLNEMINDKRSRRLFKKISKIIYKEMRKGNYSVCIEIENWWVKYRDKYDYIDLIQCVFEQPDNVKTKIIHDDSAQSAIKISWAGIQRSNFAKDDTVNKYEIWV